MSGASDWERGVGEIPKVIVDENYLPPELAAQILERESRLGPPELSPQDRELLTCLAEECAEVIQRCTKILRFGLRENPWTGKHNADTLESELGDVRAFAELLARRGVVSLDRIQDLADVKIHKLFVGDGRLRSVKIEDVKGCPITAHASDCDCDGRAGDR